MEPEPLQRHFNLDYSEHDSFETFERNIQIWREYRTAANETLTRLFDLTVDDFIAALDQIDEAAGYVEMTSEARGLSPALGTVAARHWVGLWWSRGLNEHQIAALLSRYGERSLVLQELAVHLAGRTTVVDDRRIVSLHREGRTVLEISRLTGWNRPTIFKALERCGYSPNAKLKHTPDAVRLAVIRMRGEGKSYVHIAKATTLPLSTVKSILRLAAEKGLVADWGTKDGGPWTKPASA